MVTLVALGTLLLSAGPSAAIWLGMLHRRAHLLVVTIIAAFTWVVAVTLASIVWLAIPPLKQTYPWVLFVVVTAQEILRMLLFRLFRTLGNSSSGVEAFLRTGAKNETLSGMSVGVGFGFMSVLLHFFSVLADAFADDTAIYIDTCRHNFFVAAASFSMAFSILHILLGVLVWPAYSDRNGLPYVLLCYVLHLSISEACLANRRHNGCSWGLGLVWGLIAVVGLFTAYVAKRRMAEEAAE